MPAREVRAAPWGRRMLIVAAVGLAGGLGALVMVGGGGPEAVDAALDRGDLNAARRAADALLEAHPDDPITFVALGHVALREGDLNTAQRQFDRAIALDADIASEVRFSRVVLDLVARNAPGVEPIVRSVARHGGLGSSGFLVRVFETAPTRSTRAIAYGGLERLELADSAPDALARLSEDLAAVPAQACQERRWYLERIVEFDDPAVQAVLRAERARKGPYPAVSVNACLQKTLDAHLEPSGKDE